MVLLAQWYKTGADCTYTISNKIRKGNAIPEVRSASQLKTRKIYQQRLRFQQVAVPTTTWQYNSLKTSYHNDEMGEQGICLGPRDLPTSLNYTSYWDTKLWLLRSDKTTSLWNSSRKWAHYPSPK
jgi:hypothetical protein